MSKPYEECTTEEKAQIQSDLARGRMVSEIERDLARFIREIARDAYLAGVKDGKNHREPA